MALCTLGVVIGVIQGAFTPPAYMYYMLNGGYGAVIGVVTHKMGHIMTNNAKLEKEGKLS